MENDASIDPSTILGRAYNGAFASKKRVTFKSTVMIDDDDDDGDGMTAEERMDQMLKDLGRDEIHDKIRDTHAKKAEEQVSVISVKLECLSNGHKNSKTLFLTLSVTHTAQAQFWQFTSAEATFWDATNSHHTLPVFASGKAFVPR